jgi:acyl-CoA thioester hydrolase
MYSFGGYKNVNKIQHKKINLLLIINYYFRKLNKKKKMMKSSTKTRIRYYETDQMGVVYHGNYAQFFEMGRTEWLRSLGLSYKDMENSGLMLPVIAINFNFIKSALYDDVLTIHTFLKKEPLVKIEFTYEIKNQNNELICTGSSVLAFMQIKTMKPTRCPEYLLKGLGF